MRKIGAREARGGASPARAKAKLAKHVGRKPRATPTHCGNPPPLGARASRYVVLAAGLLAGTAAAQPSSGTVDDSLSALPAVTVSGRSDPATSVGPGIGYTAARSATGSKTDTPLAEIPQAISVVTAEQMRDQEVQSIGQALRYTPGVIGEQFGGLNTTIDYFVVRGFPNQFPFIDGLATETFFTLLAPAVDPYALERIDVLHGPASVLYGQTVPGGMVNLVTKRPTREALHEISVESGSYGNVGGRLDLSGPVTQDARLLYRFTAALGSSGSQQDYYQDKRVYVAPSLTWQPSADTTFTLLSHFSYRRSGYPSADLPADGTLYPTARGRIGTGLFDGEPEHNTVRRAESAIGYEFEHRFSDTVTVRQRARYTHVALNEDVVGNAGLQDDFETIDRYGFAAKASADIFAIDNQAQFKFDTGPLRHTVLLGLDYLRSIDRWAENDALSVPSLNLYRPSYGGAIEYGGVDYSVTHHLNQTGLYAQDQLRLGKWVATFGVRQDWARTDEYDRLANVTTQENTARRLTWRAGLVYLFDNGFAPYLSYATSFQPGLGSTYNGAALKPTTGQSVEAGIKYQPPGQSSFAMLSLYDTLQKNVTEPDYLHPDGSFVVQTGAQRVKGVELSGVLDLGTGLKATASYSYMDGTITASDQGFAGNRAVNVPRNTVSAWLDKTLSQGLFAGFGVGAGVRYIGRQYGDSANTVRMPSVTLVDAALHLDLDRHWRFSVNAANLFDRVYVNCQAANYCAYGLRRNVIGRATYVW
ncbi:TonB-dependent siderophore receptor [Chitinasiproducens palmae]|uniref:Iron complex outermembrane recepter protein n=1 Tax=Chitinasiproducens palmae TaxID=1770053 RepID=A0A1H2PSV3_9BURK|nr:TonB-dependent siderophore receptor [Chitinasiproducens palmae]SDV50125.1 iron complex outermembrane recepter protein [Chitinasiproducens palmae]